MILKHLMGKNTICAIKNISIHLYNIYIKLPKFLIILLCSLIFYRVNIVKALKKLLLVRYYNFTDFMLLFLGLILLAIN